MSWLLWLLGAIVFGVIEMLSLDFIFIMLAGGALGGMVAAFATSSLAIQVVTFALISALLLFLVRPAVKGWMENHSPNLRTNAHALVGKRAVILEDVTDRGGLVKLAGEDWSARSSRPGEVFVVGMDVTVVRIEGAFAIVGPLDWNRG